MAEFAKWFLVGMLAINALLVIAAVGKPRRTLKPSDAVSVVVFQALYIVLIVVFWTVPA